MRESDGDEIFPRRLGHLTAAVDSTGKLSRSEGKGGGKDHSFGSVERAGILSIFVGRS